MWRRRRSFCRQNMFIFRRSNFSQIPMHHNSYYYDILPAINLSTLSPKIFAQFILIEQLRSSFGFTSKQPATLPSHLIIPLNKTAICPARNSQPSVVWEWKIYVVFFWYIDFTLAYSTIRHQSILCILQLSSRRSPDVQSVRAGMQKDFSVGGD